MGFKAASRAGAKLRMAITGPSGSGKTYSAMRIATAFVPGHRFAVLDTEHESASLYADEFPFDVQPIEDFAPDNYIRVIREAVRDRYELIIIDSLSHAWMGVGGILDQLDNAKGNFNKWKDLTPQQNDLVDTIIRAPIHIIATMRSKQEYAVEIGSNGRPVPRKLGMAPIQRDGTEYEFGVVLDMDIDHVAVASKTRCKGLDGKRFRKPGEDVAEILRAWLGAGGGHDVTATRQPERQPASDESERTARTPEPFEDIPQALRGFLDDLGDVDGLSTVAPYWVKHRDSLRPLSDAHKALAWKRLCEHVGQLTDSSKIDGSIGDWIKQSVGRIDAGDPGPADQTPQHPAESIVDKARRAFADTRDARALLMLAPNVLRVEGADRSAVAESYRDRWVAMVTDLDAKARKRVLSSIGGMPADIWEMCDWQPFRRLLGAEDDVVNVVDNDGSGTVDAPLGGDY